ncbi:MAG TPA: class I SAM-dependent methyltransferase [Verrucomicrobiae bacterium]|nr:class I SAM-dependent methyltransferase [Verrucomicrobiae bacterium]
MRCPNCKRPFFFLSDPGPGQEKTGQCSKCRFRAEAQLPSYDSYHEDLYPDRYKRDVKTDPQIKFIFDHLKIREGERVADLGCGVGDYTRAISGLTKNVTGYDLSVDAAREKYPGLEFVQADFQKTLPIPDGAVDKVVSVSVIEHLPAWGFFLQECRRILKPGGTIALTTCDRDFFLHDFHYDLTHLQEWTLREFEALAGKSFEKIRAEKTCSMFKYYPANWIFCRAVKPDLTFIGRKV